ncbi:MAG: hypothetical protein EP330_29110 [Deltaproteobacteria bacterium]|nr:MAG: hypothetical protein EP330_29110 [Deltaproteobacteria bacterium]
MSLDVRAAAAALVVLALVLARSRSHARSRGLVVGVGLVLLGIALAVEGAPDWLIRVDPVSQPRLIACGVGLMAVFAVLPRRFSSAENVVGLVFLALAHIGLVVAPEGPPVMTAWALSCVLTALALPKGPARRLAIPYLTLAAGAGVAGLVLGGTAGQALVVLAVGVRLGVFPFHSWVVGAHEFAPMALAVGVTAPMGAIGLVARSPLGFDGEIAVLAIGGLAVAALITAGLAVVQTGLSRAVGFLTVSIATVVFLGVLDADSIGHLGGLMMWSLTSLSLLGMGLVAAALQSRIGDVDLRDYRGLLHRTPTFAALFLLFSMAAVGAPGTADFASEDLVLHGGIGHHPVLLLLFIAAISAQAYGALHLFFRVFFGPPEAGFVPDALRRERTVLLAIAAVLVIAGLAPQLLLDGWLPNTDAVTSLVP